MPDRYKRILGMLAFVAILMSPVFGIGQGILSEQEDTGSINSNSQRISELESQIAALLAERSPRRTIVLNSESGFYLGYSFFFAKTFMKESFQATTTNDGGTAVPSTDDTLSLVPLTNDYELTPRIVLGFAGQGGLGFRASYWQFDHNATPITLVSDGSSGAGGTGTHIPSATVTTVIFPATITAALPGDVLRIQNGMEVHTVDLEGTVDFRIWRADVRVGGGVRGSSVKQTFSGSVTSPAAAGAVVSRLNWLRDFNGIGPTVSVDARQPIGFGGLSAVGRFRGSLLFGEKTLQRSASATGVGVLTLPNAAPAFVTFNDGDEVSGAFELALGGEWRRELGNWGRLHLSGTYEGQLWTAAGQPTLTFLGFHGFSVNIGILR